MGTIPENDSAGPLRSGHGELVDPVTPEGRLLAWRLFFQAVAEERPGVLTDLLRPDALSLEPGTVDGERGISRAVREWCERWRLPIEYATEPGWNTLLDGIWRQHRGEPLPQTFSFSDAASAYYVQLHSDFVDVYPEIAAQLGIDAGLRRMAAARDPDPGAYVRAVWNSAPGALVAISLRVPLYLSWDPTAERMDDAEARMVADFRQLLRKELERIRAAFIAERFLEPSQLENLDIFRWLARRHLEPKETPETIAERSKVHIDTIKKGLARARTALGWDIQESPGRPRNEST